MQGRSSNKVDNKIQCFPKENWREEFNIANKINIKFMEWTIDYEKNFLNNLLTLKGQKEIKDLSKNTMS